MPSVDSYMYETVLPYSKLNIIRAFIMLGDYEYYGFDGTTWMR